VDFGEPYATLRNQGMILAGDGLKMSKSKGNVITPDSVVEKYGADALRVYELFIAPFDQSVAWSDRGVQGCLRFLSRFWNLAGEVVEAQGSGVAETDAAADKGRQVLRTLNKTIRKVTHDMDGLRFNTAVSALMELQNEVLDVWSNARGALTLAQWRAVVTDITLLLAPMAPHVAAEVWELLGQGGTVLDAAWPGWDAELAADEVVTVVVQVNGKLRDRLRLPVDAEKDDVLAQAKAAANTARFFEDKQILKEIYVPGKLVNFVVK
jgi:leucyl-tRNA synthetase